MSTYVPIQAITLSANTAVVSFTGIPQNYTDLLLVIEGALTASGNRRIYFNGDSSNQSSTALFGTGSSSGSARYSGAGTCYLDVVNAVTNRYNNIVHIMNYSNTTTHKTYLSRHNSAGASAEAIVGLWRSTAAITSFDLNVATGVGAIYGSGTTFTLYGVGSGAPKAFGGNRVVTDGTYWYHAFTSSGIFEPVQNLNADVLVIAGGGAGGSNVGGGGGAGGVRLLSSQSINSSVSVIVGAGGADGINRVGNSGSNSSFAANASIGGGGGGGYSGGALPGLNGGSGGGGGGGTQYGGNGSGGTGTAGQGSNGGSGSTIEAGGGGGGASGTGGNGSGYFGGNGGAATSAYSSWATATSTGVGGAYAGGGGGTGGVSGTGGSSGGGGASNGSTGEGSQAVNATANTGSGAGGSRGGASFSANGGSGIVIVRYLV